jgi:DNA-binding LacI/PurR family transcriptional regulator
MPNDLMSHPNVPRYIKLAEELRSQVRSRRLRPGDRLPSFTDMKAGGVSQNTLERVHALLEREGLIVRERGRGVFVAKSLPLEAPTIAIVQEAFSETHHTYYFARLLAGIQEAAQREDVRLLLMSAPHEASQWNDVHGVLVWEGRPGKPAVKPPAHLPQVSVLLPAGKFPSVNVSDYKGIYEATEYLIRLGHQRIAYLMLADHPILDTRLQAYQDALLNAGIVPNPRWVRNKSVPLGKTGHRMEQGRKSMSAWLAEGWKKLKCTALLVQNDFIALGALEELRKAGIGVPEDVSVMGFDGLDLCDIALPRLSTVEVPLREVGSAALELLLKQLHGVEFTPHIELSTRLKIQESTSSPLT